MLSSVAAKRWAVVCSPQYCIPRDLPVLHGPPSNTQLTHGQDGQHIFAERWRVLQGGIVEELTLDAGACGTQTR